jgi:hypothetical protein
VSTESEYQTSEYLEEVISIEKNLSHDKRKRRNLVGLGRNSLFLSAGEGGESGAHLRRCGVI